MGAMRVMVACAAVALAGCTAETVRREIGTVQPGMGPIQVSGRLGAPEIRRAQGNLKAWQYCWQGVVADDYVIVWFRDDRLVGTTIDDDFPMTSCANRFDEFSWDDVPTTNS